MIGWRDPGMGWTQRAPVCDTRGMEHTRFARGMVLAFALCLPFWALVVWLFVR